MLVLLGGPLLTDEKVLQEGGMEGGGEGGLGGSPQERKYGGREGWKKGRWEGRGITAKADSLPRLGGQTEACQPRDARGPRETRRGSE